jgi:hypothetical protein
MISIIVCSVNTSRCNKLRENIAKYIGVEFEFLYLNNREKKWSLSRVYNYLAEQAKYPYLCFVHEDVLIDTEHWGKKIISFAALDLHCGVLGFSGRVNAPYNLTSSWGTVAKDRRANVWYDYNGGSYSERRLNFNVHHFFPDPQGLAISRVVCIDGLFHFVRKEVWQEIRYDEKTFNDFHFYDTDFSFAVAQRYNNYVLHDMEVYHESSGNITHSFIEGIILFWKKWNNVLKAGVPSSLLTEWKECRSALYFCKKSKTNIGKMLVQILKRNSFFFFIGLLLFLPYVKTIQLFGRKKLTT